MTIPQRDPARLDPSVLDSLRLPGVVPPRQGRSRALMAALIETALEMLKTRGFDGLSIAELCAETGFTVGSFYGRFESKDAFLAAVQHAVVADAALRIEARLTPERFAGQSLREVLGRLVRGSVRWTRAHEGLVRASLQAAQADPAIWSPMRELGRLQAGRALPVVLGCLGRPAGPADEAAVRLAFQMLFGTLNIMVLVNPGPLTLEEEAAPARLAEAMARLIEGA